VALELFAFSLRQLTAEVLIDQFVFRCQKLIGDPYGG
jgi:hypothetical protein